MVKIDANTLDKDVDWLEQKDETEGYAMSSIMSTIGKSRRQHIGNMADPPKMWRTLKEVHTRPEELKIVSLLMAISNAETLKGRTFEDKVCRRN